MNFIERDPTVLGSAPEIIKKGMLITAGSIDGGFNTMTASWGMLGELWNRPVCTCFIRPQRYTFGFAEKNEYITFCFFDENDDNTEKILNICGTKSGRDTDKCAECALTPLPVADGRAVVFAEAKTVLVCRKLYVSDIEEDSFVDRTCLATYKKKDYHRCYTCAIEQVLVRE